VVGLVLTAVGAIALVLGYTALEWYKASESQHAKLSDLRSIVHLPGFPSGFPKAFFGWLDWVLLGAVIAFAIIANLPSPTATAFRVLTPLVGAAGIAGILLALNDQALSNGHIFTNAWLGLYASLAGFLIVGIAGVIGPQRANR